MTRRNYIQTTIAATIFAALIAAPVCAQQIADPGFKSVGRGAPVAGARLAGHRDAADPKLRMVVPFSGSFS